VAGRGTAREEQPGRTRFAPRCVKDVVEERLFAHRRLGVPPFMLRPRVAGGDCSPPGRSN
jgi:hypothetical protein